MLDGELLLKKKKFLASHYYKKSLKGNSTNQKSKAIQNKNSNIITVFHLAVSTSNT